MDQKTFEEAVKSCGTKLVSITYKKEVKLNAKQKKLGFERIVKQGSFVAQLTSASQNWRTKEYIASGAITEAKPQPWRQKKDANGKAYGKCLFMNVSDPENPKMMVQVTPLSSDINPKKKHADSRYDKIVEEAKKGNLSIRSVAKATKMELPLHRKKSEYYVVRGGIAYVATASQLIKEGIARSSLYSVPSEKDPIQADMECHALDDIIEIRCGKKVWH